MFQDGDVKSKIKFYSKFSKTITGIFIIYRFDYFTKCFILFCKW